MYEFKSILPLFPIEYRRKLTHAIIETYHAMRQNPEIWDKSDYGQVRDMYHSVQYWSMNVLEARGYTNTSINPFEADNYPPH